MNEKEYLHEVAGRYQISNANVKIWTESKDAYRKEFISLSEAAYDHRQFMLPVRTVEVPESFFEKTGMTNEEFVSTRFPGWNVEHLEKNIETGITVFVFKRDPKFMPNSVPIDNGIVAKTLIEYTPEVDWVTLEKERPDLYDRLMKPVVVKEVDDEELEKLMEEDPEILAILQRHMKVREPAVRLNISEVDDGQGLLN